MTERELLNSLYAEVSDLEWEELTDPMPCLLIGSFNRAVMLELKQRHASPDAVGQAEIDDKRVQGLRHSLEDYLRQYMADMPEGHKWIILSCLYLAFLAKRPMHPQKTVGYRAVQENGRVVYRCPAKSRDPYAVCAWCVCEFDFDGSGIDANSGI